MDTGDLLQDEVHSEATELVISLFEHYHASICAYLSCLVGDWETAYDLAQETFLTAFRTRHQLAQIGNRRAWLYRVATNLAIDSLRRQRRFAWLPWRKVEASRPIGHSLMAGAEMAGAEERATVAQVLATLPIHYRVPLLLYTCYGFTVRKVAETLNLSEGNVKTRLYRAREMFRQAYESE